MYTCRCAMHIRHIHRCAIFVHECVIRICLEWMNAWYTYVSYMHAWYTYVSSLNAWHTYVMNTWYTYVSSLNACTVLQYPSKQCLISECVIHPCLVYVDARYTDITHKWHVASAYTNARCTYKKYIDAHISHIYRCAICLRPTQPVMYVPLQVDRFQIFILLIVQYNF